MSLADAERQTGPFVLRTLLDDVPLSADGDRDDIEIRCVEFLGTFVQSWSKYKVTS